ncbi:MAG: PP2C family protein-serine/threonine phosphatase, partial [Omnitrophica WOR_2 bacterium]
MSPAEPAHLDIAAGSNPGVSGKNNEDRFAVSTQAAGPGREQPSVLAVVSDGIGGHRAGEVAAEIAVETITQLVANANTEDPVSVLEEAITNASQAIYRESESEADHRGMGATCACAWVIGDQLYTASVGDSRIYLVRNGRIHQLTTDHTWIQEAIDQGVLTADEARGHPNAHVIRRYLGSRTAVVPDVRLRLRTGESEEQSRANQGLPLRPGDLIMLCSDGLTDLVTDEEILATLSNENQNDAVDTLIDLANERGGHDNITIVLLHVPQPEMATMPVGVAPATSPNPQPRIATMPVGVAPAASPDPQPKSPAIFPQLVAPRSRLFLFACLSVIGLLAVGALLVGGLYSFFDGFSLFP